MKHRPFWSLLMYAFGYMSVNTIRTVTSVCSRVTQLMLVVPFLGGGFHYLSRKGHVFIFALSASMRHFGFSSGGKAQVLLIT